MKCKTIYGLLLLTCLTLAGCNSEKDSKISSSGMVMGTLVNQVIYLNSETDHFLPEEKITDDILKNMVDLEKELLSRRLDTSALYKVNENAKQQDVEVRDKELLAIINECRDVATQSGGALDIAMGSLIELWDIDGISAGLREGKVPERKKIEALLPYCGMKNLIWQKDTVIVKQGAKLDFGAVGKGFALDETKQLLQEHGEVRGAIITLGGSVLTYGQKENGEPWRVAIVDPRDTGNNLGALQLMGQWCVSTSGDYERYFMQDGRRYHHILNPTTGYPADSGIVGITVVSKSGFLSDALSTACFVLGKEKGIELLKLFEASGVILEEDGTVTVYENDSFRDEIEFYKD